MARSSETETTVRAADLPGRSRRGTFQVSTDVWVGKDCVPKVVQVEADSPVLLPPKSRPMYAALSEQSYRAWFELAGVHQNKWSTNIKESSLTI